MPLRKLRAYLVMMPRMHAERMLAESELSGWAHTKEADRRRRIAEWKRVARGESQPGYDAQGRRVLHGSHDVRRFFSEHGLGT